MVMFAEKYGLYAPEEVMGMKSNMPPPQTNSNITHILCWSQGSKISAQRINNIFSENIFLDAFNMLRLFRKHFFNMYVGLSRYFQLCVSIIFADAKLFRFLSKPYFFLHPECWTSCTLSPPPFYLLLSFPLPVRGCCASNAEPPVYPVLASFLLDLLLSSPRVVFCAPNAEFPVPCARLRSLSFLSFPRTLEF